MAFTLAYSVVERNDNLLLTVTDTSGEVATGTATGWGAPNPDYTAIDGVTHTLGLNITVTTSDDVSVTYDTIDLFAEFGPFAAVTDLVFPLDMTYLKVSGVSAGAATDAFPDGIYDFEYVYDDTLLSEESTEVSILIDGAVQNAVYELLRSVPTMYDCDVPHSKEVLDIVFTRLFLNSIRASAVVSRRSSIISQLYTLERLVTNVSYYTW
jgi:hypothetical protein